MIIATNVAETSVTLRAVKFVFDLGFTKSPVFDPKTGVQSLDMRYVTTSEAEQRGGRCGRANSGLWVKFFRKADW